MTETVPATLTNMKLDESSASHSGEVRQPLEAPVALFERARQALAEAVRVDQVMGVHSQAERLKLYAKQAGDRALMADAMVLQVRSKRRLGELLIEARERGQLRGGRPRNQPELFAGNGAETEPFPQVTLAEAGINKKLSSEAQKLAGTDAGQFEAVVERAREKVMSGGAVVVNPIKDLKTSEKKVARAIREATLAMRQRALPQKTYGVILEDPEWEFETYSPAGMDRAAANHYPTSPTAVIAARDVSAQVANDCVLFLWATVPMLPQALEVMAARGFAYKTHFAWDKVVAGTGYWNRNRHELLLVGTRGSVPAPAPGTQWDSLVASAKGAHSEKPEWAYALIEAYFPNLPKIELNARTRRDGWDAWGFEAPEDEDDSAPRSGEGANRFGDPDSDAGALPPEPAPAADGSTDTPGGPGAEEGHHAAQASSALPPIPVIEEAA